MKIDYLWHSEFLMELENKNSQKVRILCDAWLSDYACWDMMWRNPTFKIDYNTIWKIDAVFLSHSHTDHVDPYTLIDLYKKLDHKPVLLIPETIEFLVPLFEKYLQNPEIIILKNKQEIEFSWIKILWFVFDTNFITNEDDVMWLFVYNETEILFNEVDLVPPELEEVHEYMFKIFTRHNFQQRVYIATRNELEWNLQILDVEPNKRKSYAKEYKKRRSEEIEFDYMKHIEEYVEYPDIFSLPNMNKIFIGQWITYPKSLNPDFLKFQVMTLSEEVEIEKRFSIMYGKNLHIDFLEASKSFIINNNSIKYNWDIPYLNDIDFCKQQNDFWLNITRNTLKEPMNNDSRNNSEIEDKVFNIINNRFLPYRFANKQDCIKSVILHSQDRNYNILVKFGTSQDYTNVVFQYNFSQTKFIKTSYVNQKIDEEYWGNDLDDYLEWKQELYSNFHHTLDSKKAYRLWTCLWSNYINNDLLYNKYAYHFEQANNGKTSWDFVLPVYKKLEQ